MRMLAGSRKVYRYENMCRQQVTNIFTNQLHLYPHPNLPQNLKQVHLPLLEFAK